MPQFQSFVPTRRFVSKGMNLNRPVDAISDVQYAYLQNVRSYVEGRLESRPGLSLVSGAADFASAPPNYIHSGYTLGQFNPNLNNPLRFIGINNALYSGPVTFPATFVPTAALVPLSGNPLSFVAAEPSNASNSWLYMYDSLNQRRFSPNQLVAGVPRAFGIGYQVPNTGGINHTWFRPTGITRPGGGALTGSYFYRIQTRDLKTGVLSQPGAPTYTAVVLAAQSTRFTMPTINDVDATPLQGDIYRFGGAINDWRLVGSAPCDGATVFTDNLIDTLAQSAQPLDFSRFQPWVIQDIPRTFTVTTAAAVAGTGIGDGSGSVITRTAGDLFNFQWLPGTPFTINGTIPVTFIRNIDANNIEVQEDVGVIVGATMTVVGALISGQPLPFVWGPYGSGAGGLTIFACGNTLSPGTLYWTTGNDPDSTNPSLSLEITDPSEPLMNGCIYNGRIYVWSSERMWEITPSLATAGQFVAQVLPGAKGLDSSWFFTVGDYIYFGYKDGIYRTAGGLPETVTDDDLFPLFQHDGQSGQTCTIQNPDNFGSPILIQPPDPNKSNTFRLSWGDGDLYFDYIEANSGNARTLVRSKVPMEGGEAFAWSTDIYGVGAAGCRVWRYWEKGTKFGPTETPRHSMLVGVDNKLYQFGGASDGGGAIPGRVQTGADDLGDARALKLIGDAYILSRPNGATITCRVLSQNNSAQLATLALVNNATDYSKTVIDINAGVGSLERTVGLWFSWATTVQEVEIYEYNYSWVAKPEVTLLRATDWTNDGSDSSKFLKTVIVHANTFGATRTFQLQYTNELNATPQVAGTFNITTQQEEDVPFAVVPPVVGQNFRLVPTDANTWELFGATYGYDLYPEYLSINEDYTLDKWPTAKFVRGIRIEGDTLNNPINFSLIHDGTTLAINAITQNGRTLTVVGFTPFLASEIKFIPLANWRKHSVTYIFDEYPDYAILISPWDNGGTTAPKHVRGVRIKADTLNISISVNIQRDGGAVAATIAAVQHNGQQEIVYAFATPFAAYLLRLVPAASWGFFEAVWIYDEYPDSATLLTAWDNGGIDRVKYVRGGRLHIDTANAVVNVAIQADGGGTIYTIPNVQANGQQEIPFAVPTPFLAYLMRFLPAAAARIWGCTWDADPYPDLTAEITQWDNGGTPKSKYMRGGRLRVDTANAPVNVDIQADGGGVAATITGVTGNGQQEFPFAIALPFPALLLRFVPAGPARIFDVDWDYDEYPDLTAEITAWSDAGTPKSKFIRGLRLKVDTNNLPVNIPIQTDGGGVAATLAAIVGNGQQEIPRAIAVPFNAYLLRFAPAGPARIFSADWDYDVYPDLTTEQSPVVTVNNGDAAYIQGFKLAIDDNGVPARIQVVYDNNQNGPILTTTGNAGKADYIFPNAANPFAPFIAHTITYKPLDPVRGFWTEGVVVFEPVPDLATNWQTQQTNHDLPGYHYMRDAWVAYQSAPGAVGNEVFRIVTEYGTQSYNLPVNSTYARVYLPLAPQKAKWRSYEVTSVLGVRVFVRDTMVRVRAWGSAGEWVQVQPFGDFSRQIGARI